jgi:MFS family permease
MSQKNCILVCLIAQALIYLMQYFNSSIEMVYFARVLQGFFDNINSVGKSFIFEFADRDYIEICFTFKGFAALVCGNVFPKIGNWVYDGFNRDYPSSCMFWFWFSVVISVIFYVLFYVLPISENTQEAYDKK